MLAVVTAARQGRALQGARAAAWALHTCTPARSAAIPQESEHAGTSEQQAPEAAATRHRPPSSLVVQRQPDNQLQRTFTTAINAINRLVMLLGSLQHSSANESYVRRYLERTVGFDSFTLEYLHVVRPATFRLSVGRDIEPVVSWLRSINIRDEELKELLRHTPAILSASVDEQLEPLASFIQAAGGSPRDVLLAYPGIAALPVGTIKGSHHVMHQLGCADEDINLLLLSLPDLYAQLASTLQSLFSDFGVAAWKLHTRQRRQFAGMIHHHMSHWNPGSHKGRRRTAGGTGAATEAAHASDSEDDMGASSSSSSGRAGSAGVSSGKGLLPSRSNHLNGGGAASSGGTHWQQHKPGAAAGSHDRTAPSPATYLSTSYLLDQEVYRSLLRVQAALEVLRLQETEEDWNAAVGQLAHAVDMMGQLAGSSEGKEAGRQ